MTIIDSFASDSTAPNGGGFLYAKGEATVYVYNTTMQSGYANVDAGSMCDQEGTTCHYFNCIFKDGVSPLGTAGSAVSDKAVASFTDCVFENNIVTSGNGGALAVSVGSVIYVRRSSFVNHRATSIGGCFLIYGGGTMHIEDTDVSGCARVLICSVQSVLVRGVARLPFRSVPCRTAPRRAMPCHSVPFRCLYCVCVVARLATKRMESLYYTCSWRTTNVSCVQVLVRWIGWRI